MESETFERTRLGDVATFVNGDRGSNYPKEADYRDQGIPFISAIDIATGSLDLGGAKKITPGAYERLRNGKIRRGDLLFCLRGSIGKSAMVRNDQKGAIASSLVIIRGTEQASTKFIQYLLSSPLGQSLALRLNNGSVQPNISVRDMKGLEFLLPPVAQQEAIVDFLGSIDDRIDLLRQTNTTLEAIAQALFKSWFVDFDPVHAKAEGRKSEAMDAATAALFPSEFEESELGLIPRGWQVSTLSEHVDAERGLSYKGAGLTSAGDGLPMHNLNSVLEGGGYKYAGIKYYNGAYKERHLAEAGDIIVANTEQGHHYRLIGFPAIVPCRFTDGIFTHHLYRVRAKKGSPIARHWLYYCLMTSAVRDQIISCSNGSTVNMLKPAGLQIPQMVVPPAKLCRAFDAVAEDLRTKIESGVDRAETLAQLRDTLLPRLISGKLRLPEARELAEVET